MEQTYRIHWLSITIWITLHEFRKIWEERFDKKFGILIDKKHGGMGFRSIHESIGGIKVYSDPINMSESKGHYLSFQIPGEACDALTPEMIHELFLHLEENFEDRYQVTRLDVAFDNVPFTPKEFYDALYEDKARTYAKRETIEYIDSPFKLQEDGQTKGCQTASIGGSSSERKVRVYNKRGFTRIELQARKERANAIAEAVILNDPESWGVAFVGHLRDFIDLLEDKESGLMVSFWAEFVYSSIRANLKIKKPKVKEKKKMMDWLMFQVAPTFSAMIDIYGDDSYKALYKWGKERRGDKFDSILFDDDGGNDDD